MHCLATDLTSAHATLPGGRSVPVTGGWFALETGVLRYVSVDLGGWLGSDAVLVTPDRLTWDGAQKSATLDLSEEAITAAPRWPDTDGISLADWPPILIGPLGNTLSPPLIEAQAREAAQPDRPAGPDTTAPTKVRPLTALDDLIGQPVFADGGELGSVTDLRLGTQGGWHLLDLIVDDGRLAVPFANLRHIGPEAGHVVVAGSAARYLERADG